MNNPLHAIVCVSVMTDAWRALPVRSLLARLQELQRSAVERHRARGITGFLICGGGYFLEWLEGEEIELRGAIKHRQQERHHAGLRVIHDGASERRFAQWSLCVLNRPDAEDSVGRQIQWLGACDAQHLQRWSPVRMVRSAIKPPQLFRAGERVSRVALFGASSLWISSLLAYLSSHWERPVVRTRVLHGEGLLSESVLEYLDVDHPLLGRLRWVNYSDAILEGELMPLVVERLSMAVLFQTQHDIDSALVFNAGCLRHLGHQDQQIPLVAVVGRGSLEYMPAVLQAFGEKGRCLEAVRAAMGDNAALWQALRKQMLHDLLSHPVQPDALFAEDSQTQSVPSPDNALASVLTPVPPAMAPDGTSALWPMLAASETDPAWLSGLLAVDSLEAVSWRAHIPAPVAGLETGARHLALRDLWGAGHALDWSAILQAQEDAWADLACQAQGEALEQMVVRLPDRVIFSCRWPVESSGVLSVITRAGWVNEMLLRTQLRDQLASLTPPAPAVV